MTEEIIPVTVTIRSTVRTDGGAPDTVRTVAPGCIRCRAGQLVLTYTEGEEGARVYNRLSTDPSGITVERRGAVCSRLTYRTGGSDRSLCRMAMLEGELEIRTHRATYSRSGARLSVELAFSTLFCQIPGETVLILTTEARKEA